MQEGMDERQPVCCYMLPPEGDNPFAVVCGKVAVTPWRCEEHRGMMPQQAQWAVWGERETMAYIATVEEVEGQEAIR